MCHVQTTVAVLVVVHQLVEVEEIIVEEEEFLVLDKYYFIKRN
jgi:hypothetical protein